MYRFIWPRTFAEILSLPGNSHTSSCLLPASMCAYDGTRSVNGIERKSIFREYADSVVEGLVDYYSKARK